MRRRLALLVLCHDSTQSCQPRLGAHEPPYERQSPEPSPCKRRGGGQGELSGCEEGREGGALARMCNRVGRLRRGGAGQYRRPLCTFLEGCSKSYANTFIRVPCTCACTVCARTMISSASLRCLSSVSLRVRCCCNCASLVAWLWIHVFCLAVLGYVCDRRRGVGG